MRGSLVCDRSKVNNDVTVILDGVNCVQKYKRRRVPVLARRRTRKVMGEDVRRGDRKSMSALPTALPTVGERNRD